jgi:hypothetical protein
MHPTIITRAPASSPSPCPRLLTPPGYIFALCSCYHHRRKLSMCSCIYNPSPPSKFYRVSTTFKTYAQNVIIVCSLTHPFAPITNILVVGLLSEFTTCCDVRPSPTSMETPGEFSVQSQTPCVCKVALDNLLTYYCRGSAWTKNCHCGTSVPSPSSIVVDL